MAFWDDVRRNIGNFFGGGNNQKKKKNEEEQQRQRAAPSAAPKITNPSQPKQAPQVKQPTNMFGTLDTKLTIDPLMVSKPKVAPIKTKQQELDELTGKNYKDALKNVERGQNWLDKGVNFFTRDNERIARQNARTRASNQYQEKHGWNADQEVLKFNEKTTDIGRETSKKIRTQNDNLNRFSKGMDKAAQVIQYVPVAGSVFNAGLAGNEQIAKRAGADLLGNNADTVRGMRNKVDFGMTNEQYDKLDAGMKQKLENIRNIGLALTPLDFTGLGGLVKSTGVSAAKKGVIQLAKGGAIDAATKTALKTSAKGALKSSIPAAALGTGASAGIQGYLTGEVDPLEALKSGLMVGGTSMLIPNATKVTPEQRDLVNAAKLGMADQSRINVDMPRTRAKSVPVVNNSPVRPLISDMTDNPGLVPRTPVPIRELSGDTPGVNRVSVPTAAERFANQPTARPDHTVDGIVPGRAEMPKTESGAVRQSPKVPSYVPEDKVDVYLKSADYQRDLRFEKMASETKSGDPFDHPDMYDNPTPEMYDNLKKPTVAPKTEALSPEKLATVREMVEGGYTEPAAREIVARPFIGERDLSLLANRAKQSGVSDTKMGDLAHKLKFGKPLDNPDIANLKKLAKHPEVKGMYGETIQNLIDAKKNSAIPASQKPTTTVEVPTPQAPEAAPKTHSAPQKTQIQVKQVRSIPVDDMSSMPDPVITPAKVKTQSAPNEVNVPVTKNESDAALPADVQEILANPRKFNKRQVAAARNQRKLARQMAKTKEQTAEAINRIDIASPASQTGEGFVPTGEFAKGVNGNAYQKVSRASEMQAAVTETANLSPSEVIRQASETANQNGGGYNRRDIRNIAALFETKRIERGTPEWNAARQILKEDGTNWGQTGALRNYTMRRNASADELISRYESKLYRMVDDPSKIDSALLDQVEAAQTAYVDTRDAATQAFNRFTESPTSANAKAYHAAQDAADRADMTAKQTEFSVAQKTLKGNADIQQVRELEKMAQQADMYQMDAVDASMLSGTGTFVRNFVNASIGNIEEGLMGRVSSRIASKLTGQNVGGGGLIRGTKRGAMNVVDASKARASAAGKNPLEHLKNWATTGNQLGDTVIDGQTQRNTLDHYTQFLKDQGYKGRELRDRASVMARQDPDNVSETYQAAARTAAGLGSGITRNNKIETTVKNIISDAISGGNPNRATEGIAKLVTRMTLGFPTAIGRSVAEGAKRFTLGAPTFIKAMRTSDPQARAVLIKEGIKQAGSGGLVIPSLFYGLGTSGAITGGYPEDQAERERWQREGITENAIKIGDDYYQLPAYLGSWAIPALFYAGLGRNNGDFGAAAADMKTVIPSLLPTDQMTNLTDVINGRTDFGKWMSQTGASAVRAATPAGALLNQIGKMIDPTQNDTNSGNVWENLVSKVINGVPGANLMLSDKTDADGNPLANPNPLAITMGAASTSQEAGVAKTQELNDQTNSTLESMASYGAFSDPNLKAVISDAKTLKIYNDIVNGKQVNPESLKKVQEAMVKGVSEKGTDTAYLEREQYDSHLTALQIKRELMTADPTQKPSDLKAMDIAIKRGEIYRDNEIPYDVISSYQDTSVSEWRKMGDPESDEYDPDTYQTLWAIDEMMAQNGVSYAKGKLDKQKYSTKKAGSGRGGSSAKMGTDFGTLKTPAGAPSVQAYEGIESRNVTVPIIEKQRPNIVHKIGFSG